MPTLPLHTTTHWTCSCCGLEREFVFHSQTDQTVCKYCDHRRQDDKERSRLHRDWWIDYKNDLVAHYNGLIAGKQARIEELKAQVQVLGSTVDGLGEVALEKYDSTSLGGIREFLQGRVVDAADAKVRRAYRSRDQFMSAVWKLDRLHQQATKRDASGREVCKCGKPLDKCPERRALAPVTSALDTWEKAQEERLQRGFAHGLPPEHPKVLAGIRRSGTHGYRY